jgi:hypothetical protein
VKLNGSYSGGMVKPAFVSAKAGWSRILSISLTGLFLLQATPPGIGWLKSKGAVAGHWQEPDEKPHSPHHHHRQSPDPGFWSVMREVHSQSFSSRIDFMMLLSHPSIRAEVGLSEEEYQQLLDFNVGLFKGIKAIHQSHLDEPLPRDQLVAKVIAHLADHDREFVQYIHQKMDFERFINLLVQARGNRSVVHDEIARRIELSAEKLAELRVITHRVWREHMDEMGDHMKDLIRRGEMKELVRQSQNAEVRQLFEKAEQKVNESVGRRLTSEQLRALEALRGEVFDMPANLLEIRFPAGQAVGPGLRGSEEQRDRRRRAE